MYDKLRPCSRRALCSAFSSSDTGHDCVPRRSRRPGCKIIEKNVPYCTLLPDADRRELQGLVQIFLAEKSFEGCGGLKLTDEIKLTIAAQACLLLLTGDRHLSLADHRPGLSQRVCCQGRQSIGTHIGGHLVLEGEVRPLGESFLKRSCRAFLG